MGNKKNFKKALARSWAKRNPFFEIPITDEISIKQIGAQVMDITLSPAGDEMAVAGYMLPEIFRAEVTREPGRLTFSVRPIAFVRHGIEEVRLFTGIPEFNIPGRAQAIMFGPDGNLWVGRNGERNLFVISREEELIDKKPLPSRPENTQFLFDCSFVPKEQTILTVEATADLEKWFWARYLWYDNEIVASDIHETSPFMYGIALRGDDNIPWLITDARSDVKGFYPGIYHGSKLFIPDICGNGIAFFPDGSAMVAVYGRAYPDAFGGRPAALAYIPAALFE